MSTVPDPNSNLVGDKEGNESSKLVAIPRRMLVMLGLIGLAFAVGVGVLVTKLADKSSPATPGPAVAIVSGKSTSGSRSSPGPTVPPATPTADPSIKVYVTGEVASPGVYQMQNGDRIIDAINRAGGFTEQADQSRLDQAARVKDEMRIEIPRQAGPVTGSVSPGSASTPVLITGPTVTTPAPGDSRINVNTASAAELDKLPGIGATLSQRLVEYRTKNGPYKTLDDLRKVPGLTRSVIEKIKDLISF